MPAAAMTWPPVSPSHDAVHILQLHPGADKPGALAAIAAAAHGDNHRVLALPATPEDADYPAHNRLRRHHQRSR